MQVISAAQPVGVNIGIHKQVPLQRVGEGCTSTEASKPKPVPRKGILTRLKNSSVGLGYMALVAFALAKSTFLWGVFNRGTQEFGFVPLPQTQNNQVEDSPHIKTFSDERVLNKILWGENLDYKKLDQGGRPNCQVMGAIQSQLLTPEGLDELKSKVEVVRYDLSADNFFIDTLVHLGNGKNVEVTYDELVNWMSPRGISPSLTTDGSLAIPILTLAMEKELTDNYQGVPPTIPSSAPILMTGKSYSVVAISPFVISSLSDDELIKMLSKAPETPIFVSSFGRIADFNEWFQRENKGQFEFLPVSPEKQVVFRTQTAERVKQISEDKPLGPISITATSSTKPSGKIVLASLGPQAVAPTKVETVPTSYFPENHFYVVKGFDPKTNTVQVTDSHGVEYKPLTLAELKSNMVAITLPTDQIPYFTKQTMLAYFLLLSAITGHVVYRRSQKTSS